MIRFLFALSAFFLLGYFSPALAEKDPIPDKAAEFLAGKKIIGSIVFPEKSAKLTPASKTKLRELASLVKKEAKDTEFLRIEGWAGHQPVSRGTTVAINRAKAVVQFFEEELKFKGAIYFTGMVRNKGEKGNNQVDVVLYENTLSTQIDSKELLNIFFD